MTSQEVMPLAAAPDMNGRSLAPLERTLALAQDALRFAEVIASTQFVPPGLRGKPDAILAAIMFGSELGLGPMQSLSKIAVIDGRPSLSAEAQRGLIRAAGHQIWTVELTNTRCVLAGQRIGEGRTEEVGWTLDDAKRAGLAGKDNWRHYPRQMLLARATSDLARLLFSDVLGGFPSTEETLEQIEAGDAPTPPASTGEALSSPTRRRRRSRGPEAAPEPPAETATAVATAPPDEPTPPPEPADPPPEGEDDAALLEAEAVAENEASEQELREQLEASAQASAVEPELITSEQRKKMQALFREREVLEREARLAYVSTVARRKVASSNDLTIAEASLVIDALEQWDPNDPASKPFPDYDPATAPFPEGY